MNTRDARLRAAGWRSGSAADFLGLREEEARYVELRMRLADAFREHRQHRHLTQLAAAKLLGSSQSRVAKMESGDATVSLDLLFRSLFRLGASRHVLVRALGPRA
jgi:predicted XRE-type DNA-binding protein